MTELWEWVVWLLAVLLASVAGIWLGVQLGTWLAMR